MGTLLKLIKPEPGPKLFQEKLTKTNIISQIAKKLK
jgi:hypothetical protein